MKRVVVTGLGLISSLGIGLEESWKKLIAGETGIDLITSYDTTDQPVRIAISFFQLSSKPIPNDEISPNPVTTTLFIIHLYLSYIFIYVKKTGYK